jgi:hypothetical protein
LTEFEELALKKIAKEYLVDCVYGRINVIAGKYDISNADISKHIGWDPAGFNQKFNRSNDVRITTFIKIYVTLMELISEKEKDLDIEGIGLSEISLDELITPNEVAVGALFNHISASVEGNAEFLSVSSCADIYKKMKPFVLVSKHNKRFSDKEIAVYIHYYKMIADTH